MLVFNAHTHLNGSISLEYLKNTAHRNNCLELYNQFVLEKDLWKKFGWIHQIMQNPEDIRLAAIDVVENSNADILEIRTTPKEMKKHSMNEYIQAFVNGLLEAKHLYPHRKARGLLSIDRTRHSLDAARGIINVALKEKQESGMIVGIDLSGNYIGDRTLTGRDLYEAIRYALEKDLGVAMHVGEIDSEIERQDFDLILQAIEKFGGKIQGKVRLGHAIYRTPSQDEIIKRLKIPIEICPSCHKRLGWWKQDEPHPILTLYQHRNRVIAGTDDSLLFECSDHEEQQTLDKMLSVPKKHLELSDSKQQEKLSAKRKQYMF